MKKAILTITFAAISPVLFAQVAETTTTTTTSMGTGTITEYTPGKTVIVKESGGPATYHFGKSVTYVTRDGKALTDEDVRRRIRVGAPIRYHFMREGDGMVIDRVIVDED